jgi:MFS transporter, DHA1 family, multidrug resistance protein
MNKNSIIVLVFATLGVTIGQCIDIYVPSMPTMVTALHVTPTMIQFTITIAFIAYGAIALVFGPLSDYFGRRIIALVGLGVFIIGSIFCVFAINIYWLLFGRVLQGFGFASASGFSAPSISDTFVGAELIKVYSYMGIAMAITPIIAPVLGGYLQQYFNWHAPFVFLFLYSLLLFVLFYKYFPETNRRLKETSIHPLMIIKTYFEILVNAKYLRFIFCVILISSGEILYVITAPFLLQTKLGVTPIQNGWLILITVGGFIIGTFLSSRVCKIFSRTKLLFIGCGFCIAATIVMLSLTLVTAMSILTIIIPMMFYMIGAGIVYPSGYSGCMTCFPEKSGASSSLTFTLQQGVVGIIATIATKFRIDTQLTLAFFLLVLSLLGLLITCFIALELKIEKPKL